MYQVKLVSAISNLYRYAEIPIEPFPSMTLLDYSDSPIVIRQVKIRRKHIKVGWPDDYEITCIVRGLDRENKEVYGQMWGQCEVKESLNENHLKR